MTPTDPTIPPDREIRIGPARVRDMTIRQARVPVYNVPALPDTTSPRRPGWFLPEYAQIRYTRATVHPVGDWRARVDVCGHRLRRDGTVSYQDAQVTYEEPQDDSDFPPIPHWLAPTVAHHHPDTDQETPA